MSSFSCACGHVTHAVDEPPGTSLVAFTHEGLGAAERRIAQQISRYLSLASDAERLAWQRAFRGASDSAEQTTPDVVEDIVGFELNEGFVSIFRCPACHRIALRDADGGRWRFFRPEA
jgi:hypothetical protein